jgi:hypothetical protein
LLSITVEFFQEYSKALEGLSFTCSLAEVNELDPVMCHDEETISFTKMVIVELDLCEILNSTTIESDDLGILEAAFVSAYNGLSLEYCDPYFRTLETASILKQGVFTPDGHLPVEIQVTGTCRGCDPDTIHIYDFPELGSSAGRRRRLRLQENRIPSTERLLESMETCYCTSNSSKGNSQVTATCPSKLKLRGNAVVATLKRSASTTFLTLSSLPVDVCSMIPTQVNEDWT